MLPKKSRGDLTESLEVEATDENSSIANSINNIAASLRKLVREINNSVEQVASSSEEMSAASEQTAQGVPTSFYKCYPLAAGSQEQANSVTLSLENINQISRAIQMISNGAIVLLILSKSTEENASNGYSQAENAIDKINQIKSTSPKFQ